MFIFAHVGKRDNMAHKCATCNRWGFAAFVSYTIMYISLMVNVNNTEKIYMYKGCPRIK